MNSNLILMPALLQVFTTFIAYTLMRIRRNRASRNGEVNESRRALDDDAWPDYVRQANNNVRNQFELPVLFYFLTLLLWNLHAVGPWSLGAAWLFALSRLLHLMVHTGRNHLPTRRLVFTFGLGMVFLLFLSAIGAVWSAAFPLPAPA